MPFGRRVVGFEQERFDAVHFHQQRFQDAFACLVYADEDGVLDVASATVRRIQAVHEAGPDPTWS